jgi:uncharacterized protein (DUF1778 family)
MPRKPGRPRVPKSKSRHVLLAVRLSREESSLLERALEKVSESKSEWIRNALLAEAKKLAA